MVTEFEKSIGLKGHVNCCANCKHSKSYIDIGGHVEIECKRFNLDVFGDSVCSFYEEN